MRKMNIVFKRVGADTASASGGRLSPIFPGRFFHFVTLPKHLDPELFYKFTYGDVLQSKRGDHNPNTTATPLKKLREGDVLVLYAGFQNQKRSAQKLIGIFAYIVVQKAYIIDHKTRTACEFSLAGERQVDRLNKIRSVYNLCVNDFAAWNPHALPDSCSTEVQQVLICGDVKLSKMLSKVEILTEAKDGEYTLNPDIAEKWGLRPVSHKRNGPRWVAQEKTKMVWTQLQRLP